MYDSLYNAVLYRPPVSQRDRQRMRHHRYDGTTQPGINCGKGTPACGYEKMINGFSVSA